ncbi:MAG TPA: SRPBCC domain-containing protein [Labilithrix sp.]|nr:SRPBCC domain-containing protein [Labilithrix sp.]
MSDISKKDNLRDELEEHVEVRRFERRLPHRVEKVWRALTDARELALWFPAVVEGKSEKGAALRFVFPETEEKDAEGTVTECEPPRLLAYTMGSETLRWELTPLSDDACLLVFTTETRLSRTPANDNAITARLAA